MSKFDLIELNKEAFEAGLMTKKSYGIFCRMAAERIKRKNPSFNEYDFLVACGVLS